MIFKSCYTSYFFQQKSISILIKILLEVIIILIPLINSSSIFASPSNPLFPSVLTYASLNQIDYPSNEEEVWFIINHIDMAHCDDDEGQNGHFYNIKSRAPNFFMIKYRLMETVPVNDSELIDLQNFCSVNGYNFEDSFLHYYDDTIVNINGYTKFIPGWGGGSASSREQARVQTYIWGGWRYTYNWKSIPVREFMKHRSIRDLTTPKWGYYYKGIFIDELQIMPQNPSETFSLPDTTKGGQIIEYNNREKASIISSGDYIRDLGGLFSSVSLAIKQQEPSSLIYPNVANYINDGVLQIGLYSDGLLTEFLSGEIANYDIMGEKIIWDTAKKLADSGKIYIITQNSPYPPSGPNFTSGNYRNSAERHKMYTLASYWMAKQGNYTYYSQAPLWQKLHTFWISAQEYDIGTPIGDYYLWKENNTNGDSAGQKYRVYRRDYTKAIILFRTRYDWDDAKNFKDMGAITSLYDLGGNYRILYSDKTLGPSINKIGMHLGEGVILIPEKDTIPPSPPKGLRILH